MQTIIVEVDIPSTGDSFDFRLPSTGRIGDIAREMVRILENTGNNLLFDENSMLCDRERGIILNKNDTVAQACLSDGARLMLL